jgi:hypothetical protein
MQQTALSLSMREHRHTPLHRLNRVGIHTALLRTRQEESRLARLELIIQVDQESKQRRLLSRWRRRVVDIFAFLGDAGWRPRAVDVGAVFRAWDVAVDSEASV